MRVWCAKCYVNPDRVIGRDGDVRCGNCGDRVVSLPE